MWFLAYRNSCGGCSITEVRKGIGRVMTEPARSRKRVIERRGDSEGGGRTNTEAVEQMRQKLARHMQEANRLNNQWRNSLTRVSLALAAVLAFRVYRDWEDGGGTSKANTDPTQFFRTRLVDILGVVLGLLIADFVRKQRGSYPPSFYVAFVISVLELAAWSQVAMKPDYELHVNASLPVGAFYFIFVWGSDWVMARTMLDAKKGVKSGDRLAEIVAGAAKTE